MTETSLRKERVSNPKWEASQSFIFRTRKETNSFGPCVGQEGGDAKDVPQKSGGVMRGKHAFWRPFGRPGTYPETLLGEEGAPEAPLGHLGSRQGGFGAAFGDPGRLFGGPGGAQGRHREARPLKGSQK